MSKTEWLVFLFLFLLLLALLSYYGIYARCRKTYNNKSVDTGETRYCTKFQPFVAIIYAKNCQKQVCIFCNFPFFAFLTFKMTFKFKFDLIRPTYIWGCPIFFIQEADTL